MMNRRGKNREGKGITGRRIVLIASGGISVYKTAYLSRILTREGAEVRVVMTEAASRFVTPLTFKTLTGNPVEVSLFPERENPEVIHIELAEWAERIVVAPATADLIARAAAGMAGDLASAVLCASRCPVIVAPAMNEWMWRNPATGRNIDTLEADGYSIVAPGEGELACGEAGKGRMAEPEAIAEHIRSSFAGEAVLAGKRILVTAGRTEEDIDSVRYITNRSSGRMGFAIVRRAREMGAEVALVHGAADLPVPQADRVVHARTAADMKNSVLELFKENDVLVMAAAVSDYTISTPEEGKIRRKSDTLSLKLDRVDDILKLAGETKSGSQMTVGFALEESDDDGAAMKKLENKRCDMLVLNTIGDETGFCSSTNRISIYGADGKILSTELISKDEAASVLLQELAKRAEGG